MTTYPSLQKLAGREKKPHCTQGRDVLNVNVLPPGGVPGRHAGMPWSADPERPPTGRGIEYTSLDREGLGTIGASQIGRMEL